MSTNRVERQVVVKAPRARVWAALADAEVFGAWFGVRLTGAFVSGEAVSGPIATKGYEHLTFTAWVERVEPESYLSFRWHPHAVDPSVDYSGEKTTLVEFFVTEESEGTRVRVVESGFDALPASRHLLALKMNGEGWAIQMDNLRTHLATTEVGDGASP